MQPRVGNQGGNAPRHDVRIEPATQPVPAEPDTAVMTMEPGRAAEENRMLLIGFGTGLTVAFVFLIYIVIAYSGALP